MAEATSKAGTWIVETRNPEIETDWRRVFGAFKSQRDAEDEANFGRGRNPSNEYRVRNTDKRGTERQPLATLALPSRTNWRSECFDVPSHGDYWEHFERLYPRVYSWVARVADQASTWDSSASVLIAAGAWLADLEDWAIRARCAMRDRHHIRLDSLVFELVDILGGDEATPTNGGA